MSDVNLLLDAIQSGDPEAPAQLLPLVYDELRRLAAHRLAHEAPGQTLQPTALVHEAYLRLVGEGRGEHWDGRGHFFAAAAEAMRRILVENARRKNRLKRGGDRARLHLEVAELLAPDPRAPPAPPRGGGFLLSLQQLCPQIPPTRHGGAPTAQRELCALRRPPPLTP